MQKSSIMAQGFDSFVRSSFYPLNEGLNCLKCYKKSILFLL